MNITEVVFLVGFLLFVGVLGWELYIVMNWKKTIDDLKHQPENKNPFIIKAFFLFIGTFISLSMMFAAFMSDPSQIVYISLFRYTWIGIPLSTLFFIAQIFMYLQETSKEPIKAYQSIRMR